MENKELLQRLETTHIWTSEAILKLRELVQNEKNLPNKQLLK